MMRYQRVSPDCLPLSNGKKPNNENGRSISNGLTTTSFETKGFRFRSPSRTQDHHNHHQHHLHNGGSSPPHSDNNKNQTQKNDASPSPSPSRGGTTCSGDVLLQWGQKKRSRASRSEIRSLADESSSSIQARQPISKLAGRTDSKLSSTPTMPPPPPPPPPQQYNNSRCGNLRKESSAFGSQRNLEKRSAAANGSPSRNSGSSNRAVSRSMAGKRSPPTPDKSDRKITASSRPAKDEKPNGSQADHTNRADSTPTQSEQEAVVNNTASTTTAGEKLNAEVIEWPRIYIALSRKEKEDDFFAMKGTKLPQRPKKRAKNIDKTLQMITKMLCVVCFWQYCFPGMWLSDLTKSRYEVREKKCVKKQKRRGLKGMESMDSESE
ncbi:protein ENL isoform X2 [Jatropha curcas]|uniref:protein ENL isoform X2 n=1 Tax=Jatropha curcas TaxID=180498 RepID=UPI001895FFB5|nr:protein ENL isoform X2 [Jatropha curcas]